MGTYKKPVHELCVDKTSCQHEVSIGKAGLETKREMDWQPTEQLTKDSIKKAYEQKNE